MLKEMFENDFTAIAVTGDASAVLAHCFQEGILPLEYPVRESLDSLRKSLTPAISLADVPERLFYLLTSGGNQVLGTLVLTESPQTEDLQRLTTFLQELPTRHEEKIILLTTQLADVVAKGSEEFL